VVPAVVFIVLVIIHGPVTRKRRRGDRAVEFYRWGLARLDDHWAGGGTGGERFADEHHLYAADLDLFGRGSLYERLCIARTQAGEDTLATWLKTPASPATVHARQEAVRELVPRLDLRENLALLGADIRAGIHPRELAAWGSASPVLRLWPIRLVALALATTGVVTLGLWWAGVIGPLAFVVALAADLVVALPLRSRVLRVITHVEAASDELTTFASILGCLEHERFDSTLLTTLQASLDTGDLAPSRRIAELRRLLDLLDARRNQLFAPIALLLLWGTQLAYAIEAWRQAYGTAIARWLAIVGEIEALCSLAGYAWENPDDPFPEVVVGDHGPRFEGEGLGHPLIPRAACVSNDVRLAGAAYGTAPSGLVVSGSNMSGKSTLLRTVGINTVLALAGAPVRARRLTLTPLAVGATLRIQDSLQTGTSRFYAEITRLRKIVDLTRSTPPPLFLLDEMLNGTNSHDRGIGAEAVLRGLIARGGIGLVTTHDLALSQMANALAPRAANVHFEDHLDSGVMTFDYVCRPGIMTKSNALALMKAVGLDV
jgi:hypothetical protein